MNHTVFDVVIAGGGFAGLVAAAALAEMGLHVAVVEAGPRNTERSLRGELLHPTAVRELERLGFADALAERGAARVEGIVAHSQGNNERVVLPYEGGVGNGLEHGAIVEALRCTLESRQRIRLIDGSVEEIVRESGVVIGVRFSDGRFVSSPLVVAADGRHSKLRTALGLRTSRVLLSQALGTTIDALHLPRADYGHVFVGGPGPVLVYPIGHGLARVNVDLPLDAPRQRELVIPWITERYRAHVPASLFDAMLRGFEEQPLLRAPNHAITTFSCATQGAVVLGDAGGCSHPLTATGMTSAVNDATTLAAALREHDSRRWSRDPLVVYEQRRYRFVRAREAFAQALFDIFRGQDAGDRSLRDAVFRYWQDERARRSSMAILSGDESRVRAFVSEYARVVMTAALLGTRDTYRERSFAPSSAALSGLADSARIAIDTVMTSARTRPTLMRPWRPRHGIRRAPSRASERASAE